MDFDNFVITGPATASDSSTLAVLTKNGVTSAANGVVSSLASQCLTDTFSVGSPNGVGPPVICGTNTNEYSEELVALPPPKFHYYVPVHCAVYVDASSACNTLTFQLGANGVGVMALASRAWSIKVSQRNHFFYTQCFILKK